MVDIMDPVSQLSLSISTNFFNIRVAFFNYFYEQNQLIANGTNKGIALNFNTLGVINGIIDEAIQVP